MVLRGPVRTIILYLYPRTLCRGGCGVRAKLNVRSSVRNLIGLSIAPASETFRGGTNPNGCDGVRVLIADPLLLLRPMYQMPK